MSRSFARLATVAFTTRRGGAMVDGKQLGPQPYLTAATLRCTPLDPADPGGRGERIQRLILESPVQLLETFVDAGLDIREGDQLLARGRVYLVRAVARWDWRQSEYLYLLLEEQQ